MTDEEVLIALNEAFDEAIQADGDLEKKERAEEACMFKEQTLQNALSILDPSWRWQGADLLKERFKNIFSISIFGY